MIWKEIRVDKASEHEKRKILEEANILKQLHHEFLITYYDTFIMWKTNVLYITMEYCTGTKLSKRIERKKLEGNRFKESFVWRILAQLSSALYVLHKYGGGPPILHRDLRPANVFLTEDGDAKLADFGLYRLVKYVTISIPSNNSTFIYIAPEQTRFYIQDSYLPVIYTTKTDMWCLGALIYEMCALKPIFEARSMGQLMSLHKRKTIHRIPEKYSIALQLLVSSMLCFEPSERISVQEVVADPRLKYIIDDPDRLDYERPETKLTEKQKRLALQGIAAGSLLKRVQELKSFMAEGIKDTHEADLTVKLQVLAMDQDLTAKIREIRPQIQERVFAYQTLVNEIKHLRSHEWSRSRDNSRVNDTDQTLPIAQGEVVENNEQNDNDSIDNLDL